MHFLPKVCAHNTPEIPLVPGTAGHQKSAVCANNGENQAIPEEIIVASNALLASQMTARLRALVLARGLEFGPYSLAVAELPAGRLPASRRHACLDLTHSRLLVREGLTHEQWLHAFMNVLVRLVHYAQAVMLHTSTEEHLTHSIASGMSQLARRNPELVWALLRAINPHMRRPLRAPQRVVIGKGSWSIHVLPVKTASRLRVFGQADLERRRIELDPALTGTQLAVIFLHEAIHGMHHELGVDDQTPSRIAHSRETKGLLELFRLNPGAFAWWFGLLQPHLASAHAHPLGLRHQDDPVLRRTR